MVFTAQTFSIVDLEHNSSKSTVVLILKEKNSIYIFVFQFQIIWMVNLCVARFKIMCCYGINKIKKPWHKTKILKHKPFMENKPLWILYCICWIIINAFHLVLVWSPLKYILPSPHRSFQDCIFRRSERLFAHFFLLFFQNILRRLTKNVDIYS